MDNIVNTSYTRDYVVVSADRTQVVLRPVVSDGSDSLPTYWKEFINLFGDDPLSAPDTDITIYLTQLPTEVITVDAYVDYVVEYPRVEIHFNGRVLDVSDRISCNHPNSETPGLYALDFMLSIGGGASTNIWRSWVSIEEPPILRKIITPWNRENRIIADFNRLVMEPQFMEAMYEAGVPLYNFQQANATGAVPQSAIMKYRDSRVFICDGKAFVTGPQLPSGSEITINGMKYVLGLRVITAPFTENDLYAVGSIVRYCGSDFYAIEDPNIVDGNDHRVAIPNSVVKDSRGDVINYWLSGILYDVTDAIALPDGEYHLDSLWSTIDVGGYLFQMDLLRAFPVRHYWGTYNFKNFYDYAPGDLVSLIADNVIYLYQRNETSIENRGTEEAYRPGHYKNPHWTEVYSETNKDLLRPPAIKPYTNATNAVISKTYPVREEAFRIYAKLVGIPSELVDGLGPKYSVLLWALLYRTRETFPGFKMAFNAIGLDVSSLYRVYPSVIYNGYDSEDGTELSIKDVYTEIDKVKEIARSIQADKVWTLDIYPTTRRENDPDADYDKNTGKYSPWIRYSRTGDDATTDDTVEMFLNGVWKPFYKFSHVGLDSTPSKWNYSVNNRYYRAEVNLLNRLKSDCKVDLNDDSDWIDHNKFGAISKVVGTLLSYEVPVYIYLQLCIHLAAVGRSVLRGVSNGVVLHESWGGYIGLNLYPSVVFDLATVQNHLYYPNVYYSYDGETDWTLYEDYDVLSGYRYFSFDKAVYLKFEYADGIEIESYWVSQFTPGCLGDAESTDTGNGFVDASQMAPGSVIYLCKGIAGITCCIKTSKLGATTKCWLWQYTFDGDWSFLDEKPFADWGDCQCKMYGLWNGTLEQFRASVDHCVSPGYTLTSEWHNDKLYVGGGLPRSIYLYDNMNNVLGVLVVPYQKNMVLDIDSREALLEITFSIE